MVDPREPKPHYHCFGCGAHGDAADWIQRTQNVDYRQAKRILGEPVKPVKPDPALVAARQAAERRQRALTAYRDSHPDCCCPPWLLAI